MNVKEYKKRKKVIDVLTPSGDVWKMRLPPIQQFIMAGKLPASLANKMALAANKGGSKEEILESLETEDILKNLEFCRDVLMYCAVEPRIVANADPDSETEIAPEEIDPEDFEFLLLWVMTGGKLGASLDNFRSESNESALASANRS